MTEEEVAAVLTKWIANGDMVTLTLIQGVVNTFVVFLARVVGYFIDRVVLKNERGMGIGYYVTVLVCEIIFGILASIIVAWFSRQRDRADAGSAHLMGAREPMIRALARLGGIEAGELPKSFEASGITGKAARDVRLAPADPGPHRGAAASPSGLSPAPARRSAGKARASGFSCPPRRACDARIQPLGRRRSPARSRNP